MGVHLPSLPTRETPDPTHLARWYMHRSRCCRLPDLKGPVWGARGQMVNWDSPRTEKERKKWWRVPRCCAFAPLQHARFLVEICLTRTRYLTMHLLKT